MLITLALGPAIARLGAERVLASSLLMGAICIYAVATVRLPHVWMMVVLFGAGAGFIGSQLGLNGLAASVYPAHLRSTGVGWALGVGRLGGIAGPIVGGALLSFGLPATTVMLFACGPGLLTAILVFVLGQHRRTSL
jgi:AAHS family 4-hydroxybenzoate transporter-like MFS transporter